MEDIRLELERIVTACSPIPAEPIHSGPDRELLVRLLSEEPRLACFDQHMHALGNSARSFDHQRLADILVVRSREVSVEELIGGLADYLETEFLPLKYVFLLSGVFSDADFTFSNGVILQQIENLENSRLKRILIEQQWGGIALPIVHTILSAPYAVRKHYYSNTDGRDEEVGRSIPPYELLNDTRLLISLARTPRDGVPLCASTTLVPNRFSFLESGSSWSMSPEPQTHFGPGMIEVHLRAADSYIRQFDALDGNTRSRLRILLKRLNDAKIAQDYVDKFINMRVCIENIFLNPGDHDQLTSKLKKRVSEHSTFSKTKVEKYYGELSSAVHGGRLPENSITPFSDLLALVKKMAVDVLSRGHYIEWSDIE